MVNTKLLLLLPVLGIHSSSCMGAHMSLSEYMSLSDSEIQATMHKKVLGGQTPLYTAVRKNNHESEQIIRRLVALKANPDFSDGRSWTPLRHAVNFGKQQMLDLLIELKANVHEEGVRPDGTRVSSLLSDALPDDNVGIAQSLISARAEIGLEECGDIASGIGNQALDSDSAGVGIQDGGNAREIGAEVAARAQAQIKAGQCNTILEEAIRRRALKIAKLLVAAGAPVHYVHQDGSAIIDVAVAWGDAALVQALIDRGARVDFETVINAAKTGNPKKVQIISRAYYSGQRREEVAGRVSQEEFVSGAVECGFVGAAWIAVFLFAWQLGCMASA